MSIYNLNIRITSNAEVGVCLSADRFFTIRFAEGVPGYFSSIAGVLKISQGGEEKKCSVNWPKLSLTKWKPTTGWAKSSNIK